METDYIKYEIVLRTPIGKRCGTMRLSAMQNQVSGTLNVLKNSAPFEGTLDSMGNCKITGKLITLLRTIPFTAVGKLTDSSVTLQLQTEGNVFELSGAASPQGGEQ